jgi:hypothetical protein
MIKHKIILISCHGFMGFTWAFLFVTSRYLRLLLAFSRAVIALPILMAGVKMSGLSLRDCLKKGKYTLE